MITLLWIGAAGCLAAALTLLALKGRRGEAVLPLADADSFGEAARRTWLLWGALAGALVALLVAFAVQSRVETADKPILRPGTDAVIVVDLSGSTRSASRSIARILNGLTRDPRRRLGLVVFSDTAYEALPPSTPVDGLKGWLELFAGDVPRNYPWSPSFSSGTVISSGLVLARRMLRREGVRKPHVVLVSDLVDAAPDLQKLEAVVAQYQREGIDLKIVAVKRKSSERSFGAVREFPNGAFVERAATLTIDPQRAAPADAGLIVLLVLAGFLGVVATAHEFAFHPLSWRTRT